MINTRGLVAIFLAIAWAVTTGCRTPGIMPLRDQAFSPFCCNPNLGDTHCPAGARCEQDTYYGYGYICCGSINMVWDAYGGQYRKADYDGCGRPIRRLLSTARPPPNPTAPSAMPRLPLWLGSNTMEESPSGDYECIPSNWTSEADGPLVVPIIVGEYREPEKRVDGIGKGWRGKGSVTLIRDGSCTILVDTGSATDQKLIISGLAAFVLRPEDVQYVVITQGTPEHMGNQNLFMKSKVFYSWIAIDWDHFVMTDLGKVNFIPLCSRTELHLTPGVTKDAISLLVRNVTRHGTVAVVGDLFLYDHAHDYIPKQYAGFVWDVQALLHSREKIICQADLIIPGHGAKFLTQRFNNALVEGRFNCSNILSTASPTRTRIIHNGLTESAVEIEEEG